VILVGNRTVFNDLGSEFITTDPTGAEPLIGMITSIDSVSRLSLNFQEHMVWNCHLPG
jgi:hypothetical protein